MAMIALEAVADPTRRKIVEILAGGERTAGDIVDEFQMSPPAISQHLKVLREARLVQVRTDGKHRIHSLDPRGLFEIQTWLDQTKRFWESRLDVLEKELKAHKSKMRK